METRRKFLVLALAAGAAAGLSPKLRSLGRGFESVDDLEVHIFSKHLQFLDFAAMAEAAADIGFDGVDLTVRPDGHVEPERVDDDLPSAIEMIRRHGLKATMITTSVTDADDPASQRVLQTAAGLGISYYRMGWYRHPEEIPIQESLEAFRTKARGLALLNRELQIRGCYQNHAGNYVGASIWELWALIHDLDPAWLGCQYDIRHATVEGGLSWPQGLRLIRPFVNTIIAKDVMWTQDGGAWKIANVPIGEGMVDWVRYFRLLADHGIRAPLSLHMEYPIGGAENGRRGADVDGAAVFSAMRRDLEAVRSYWREALAK